jgi:hypothetical protein
VPAGDFAPATAKATFSRSIAGRLVFRAIQKSLATPRKLQTTCSRRHVDTFACSSTWRDRTAANWHGRARVWYGLSDGRPTWFYDLSARRSPGGKLVVRRLGREAQAVRCSQHQALSARVDSA